MRRSVSDNGPTGSDGVPSDTTEDDWSRGSADDPDEVLSRSALMGAVWGWEHGDQSTVTVHVRRLRGKVEADPSQPRRLVTVWGRGYRWEPTTPGGEA